ncbi:MAG: 2-amino-4-hydroxy-6-hydroxymethyldihydropteridine diphosphokinase [Bacteroidia bacterium]
MNVQLTDVCLLFGSNSGNRLDYITNALNRVAERAGKIISKSSCYETAPWGFTGQPDFLNRVAIVETALTPVQLLQALKSIEKELGRIKIEKWKQRIIDIDILFYGDLIFESIELTIPHPLLHKRKFTLIPLNELMPGLIHPLFKKRISQLLLECEDGGEVNLLKPELIKP